MTIFLRAARIIGDLDDDFYRDERQRDVWNEASAVGFQVFSWTSLLGAAVLPWVAGRTGAWTALGILVVWFLASVTTLLYARMRDVDVYATATLWRPRGLAAAGLYLVGIAGIFVSLRFGGEPFDNDPATWAGRITGATLVLLLAAGAVAWNRRRTRVRRAEEDARDALEP
ncbi:DUF2029 domain-containing protein [Rhodococcus sp. CH91]|uniref:DUF2029 domain-containing protein n=1 Tax=Rhodococcus sp. CH91 TaxID=2910256 RepID=UPI001F4AC04D|nr:DUF2029 domain-containing protein [Rhodococcus sp. CH91]